VTNWANEEIAGDQWHGGSFDVEARRPEPKAIPGPAHEGSEPQAGDDFIPLLVPLSGLSVDVSNAGDGGEGSVVMLLSPGRERR